MISGIKDAVRESLLLKGFIGIMAISFGVWGVGDFIGTGGLDPSIAVQVGNTEITTREFQRRFDQELARFREEVGTQAARNDAFKRSIANAMVQDIAQTATVSAAAQELGIVIPIQRLQSGLFKEPAFQNSAGTFDQSRFMEVLFDNNLTEPQFLDMFASDLRRATIISPVIANTRAPNYLVENLFFYQNETRAADTLLVTSPALTESDLPSDEDLEALYEQNITAYMAPEYRKITALVIEAKHFQSLDDLVEADVRARYDEDIDRYKTSGTRRVSQLVFDTQEEASTIRAQLKPGDDLTALAATSGVPAPIDLGDLSSTSPVANMMGDAYSLPLKEVSQPVETDLGWHLFYVSAETEEATIPFEDVRDEIRQAMVEERGIDAVYEASVDVEDGIAGGTPLKEISEFVGGELIEISEMDRNGRDRSGRDVSEIFDRANFINAAFAYPEGEASQLLDTPTRSGYYVVQVDAVTPPAPRPLEEVRGDVVSLWEKQTRAEKAQALATELLSEIGPSSKFSEVAASNPSVSYAPLGPITRFGEGLDAGHIIDSNLISPAVLSALFSAQENTVISASVTDGIVIARLNQINAAQPEGRLASAQFQLKTSVIDAMREDLSDQVVKAFAARYPVEINNAVIDELIELR